VAKIGRFPLNFRGRAQKGVLQVLTDEEEIPLAAGLLDCLAAKRKGGRK
jgi:hypothetical protein